MFAIIAIRMRMIVTSYFFQHFFVLFMSAFVNECLKVLSTVCRSLTWPITWFGRMFFRSLGYRVRVVGTRATAKEAPILLAAPHSSFLDAFVAHWTNLPCLIIRHEDQKTPLLGRKSQVQSLLSCLLLALLTIKTCVHFFIIIKQNKTIVSRML